MHSVERTLAWLRVTAQKIEGQILVKPPQTTKDYMYHHPPPSGTVVERMNAGQFVACRSRVSGQASSMAQQSLHHFAELLLRPPTMCLGKVLKYMRSNLWQLYQSLLGYEFPPGPPSCASPNVQKTIFKGKSSWSPQELASIELIWICQTLLAGWKMAKDFGSSEGCVNDEEIFFGGKQTAEHEY
jgi:hypothetical protein